MEKKSGENLYFPQNFLKTIIFSQDEKIIFPAILPWFFPSVCVAMSDKNAYIYMAFVCMINTMVSYI